jgi:hypothetical protein
VIAPPPSRSRGRRGLAPLALAVVVPSCSPQPVDGGDARPFDAPPVAWRPDAAPADTLPPRLYLDLTRFDWYARAEPLRHGGHDYELLGPPVALDTDGFRQLGTYEGVDYYVRLDAADDAVLYVPVSEGFWQPFALVR